MTIKPTSVKLEGAFSAEGLFATKTRGCLRDETLDVLNPHLLK